MGETEKGHGGWGEGEECQDLRAGPILPSAGGPLPGCFAPEAIGWPLI